VRPIVEFTVKPRVAMREDLRAQARVRVVFDALLAKLGVRPG